MLQPGRILVAEYHGAFVIKLVGDVRLTFCTALDDFIERMFGSAGFSSVLIDLTSADNIDSTTLGQLAKLAIGAHKRFKMTPALVSDNPDICRILQSMGFEKIFDIRHQMPRNEHDLQKLVEHLPIVNGEDESAVRDKVLEAHRVLMGLSEHNRAQFSELVSALELGR